MKNVIIIGGGVAGVALAVYLKNYDFRVQLFEKAPMIGGKLNGWRNEDNVSLEHGMHGWWNGYSNFLEFFEENRISENLTDNIDEFSLIDIEKSIKSKFKFNNLPSPFHLFGLFKSLGTVTREDKISLFKIGYEVMKFCPHKNHELDDVSLGEFLDSKGINKRIFDLVIRPTILSNLFLEPNQISAYAALKALNFGIMSSESWKFSWLKGNVGDYFWKPVIEKHQLSESIHLKSQVEELHIENNEIQGVKVNGKITKADHYVLAVDIEAAKKLLLNCNLQAPYFKNIESLNGSDMVVTRHSFVGAPISFDHAFLTNSASVNSVLNISDIQEDTEANEVLIETHTYDGKYLIQKEEEEIKDLTKRAIIKAIPELRELQCRTSIVLKHRKSFSSYQPGSRSKRPKIQSPIRNLQIIGDWVDSEYSCEFMENAIVSSKVALNNVLKLEGIEERKKILLPPKDFTYRLMKSILKLI